MTVTDISNWLDDTYREIRSAGPDTRTLLLRRGYAAPLGEVWEACTDPDRLKCWFHPLGGDLRPGGTFQLESNARGSILRCEPPRHLGLTWAYGDGPASEVTVCLSPAEGGTADAQTVLELTHAPVPESVEMDGRLLDPVLNDPKTGIWGLGTGWEMSLIALGRFLRGEMSQGAAVKAAESDPAIPELADRCGDAWAAVVEATG
jgi:uncharacterized protein YndB with AHSA1/START domain